MKMRDTRTLGTVHTHTHTHTGSLKDSLEWNKEKKNIQGYTVFLCHFDIGKLYILFV